MVTHKKLKPFLRDNLLAMVRGSIGSPAYRNMYFGIGGKKIDVLRDGDLSCAVFVTSILKLFSLADGIHTTVAGAQADLKKSGWHKAAKPKIGSIIVWGPRYFKKSGESHKHIGFYVGKGIAISNISKKKSPGATRSDYRSIEEILTHPKLK